MDMDNDIYILELFQKQYEMKQEEILQAEKQNEELNQWIEQERQYELERYNF